MPVDQTNPSRNGGRRPRGPTSRPPGAGRTRSAGRELPGMRWVTAGVAVLAAVIGWLLLAALQGQWAAAGDHQGYQAGGLALTVEHMAWMSNDMTGNGPVAVPQGFPMDPGMMPGMQAVGDNRLRLEVDLRNVTSHLQHYAASDFTVAAPGGQTWKTSDDGGNVSITSAALQPGFQVTVDLYFDIPAKQSTNLTVRWTRGGRALEFPVNVNGVPAPHNH